MGPSDRDTDPAVDISMHETARRKDSSHRLLSHPDECVSELDRNGNVTISGVRVPELPIPVLAPAQNGATVNQCARMAITGPNGGDPGTETRDGDGHWSASVRDAAVAELAVLVVAPAHDVATAGECARIRLPQCGDPSFVSSRASLQLDYINGKVIDRVHTQDHGAPRRPGKGSEGRWSPEGRLAALSVERSELASQRASRLRLKIRGWLRLA